MAETQIGIPAATSRKSRTIQILCIDDDLKVSEAIARRLSNYNVNVTIGFFGTHGLSLATQIQPDLIITDYQMPQGDGAFVIEMLRKNEAMQYKPIIVLTGIWDQKIKDQLLKIGADAVLHKPIPNEKLIEMISQFVQIEEQ